MSDVEQRTLTINCENLTNDNLMGMSELHEYFINTFKYNGKKNNFKDEVEIETDKNKLVIKCPTSIKKSYLRFLSKKFLHRKQLSEWVRILGDGKDGYEMAFYDNVKNE